LLKIWTGKSLYNNRKKNLLKTGKSLYNKRQNISFKKRQKTNKSLNNKREKIFKKTFKKYIFTTLKGRKRLRRMEAEWAKKLQVLLQKKWLN
jgi:hypothetical protein